MEGERVEGWSSRAKQQLLQGLSPFPGCHLVTRGSGDRALT